MSKTSSAMQTSCLPFWGSFKNIWFITLRASDWLKWLQMKQLKLLKHLNWIFFHLWFHKISPSKFLARTQLKPWCPVCEQMTFFNESVEKIQKIVQNNSQMTPSVNQVIFWLYSTQNKSWTATVCTVAFNTKQSVNNRLMKSCQCTLSSDFVIL